MNILQIKYIQKIILQNLKDLDKFKELVSDIFDSVNLVINEKNKYTHAIKVLDLEQIKKENYKLIILL